MKYIVKKSVVELPETSGSISDTLNIEDKTTNAPSIRLIEEILNPTIIKPSFTSNVANATGGYYKIGSLIIVDITCRCTTTSNGGVNICSLPKAKTANSDEYVAVTTISLSDNSVAAGAIQDGTLKIIASNTSNYYRISGAYIANV
jgi:hypothetical protein